MTIIARAPTRIDLAGGTTDLWPLFLFLEHSLTINVAIDLYATAILEPLPGTEVVIVSKDQGASVRVQNVTELPLSGELSLPCRLARHFAPKGGFRLETEARVPAGSGLGGSSSLAIAVCGVFNEFGQLHYGPEELIGIARDIEAQVLRIPTGQQDYYAAMYGGLHGWDFRVNEVTRLPYEMPLQEIQDRILLLYSGLPRFSGINNWQVYKNFIDRDPVTVESLSLIHDAAQRLHHALMANNWQEVYFAIRDEWAARKKLAPSITTPDIEELLKFGHANGCSAGKVCGAGGGGCFFLIMDPPRKAPVELLARQQGYNILDCHTVSEGLILRTS